MKTLRTLLIFTGIIVGIIALISSPVKADNQEDKTVENNASLNLTEMMETESILLDNYLQLQALSKKVETIKIINQEGKTVYQGKKANAEDLVRKSTYLFKHQNEVHYLVVK